MSVLEVKGIKKSFGSNNVLKGIDFSLEKGEVLAIIGSSGSGKTTLLRCLNFLETPDSGEIYVNGKLLLDPSRPDTMNEKDIRTKRLHFGLVFQSFNLFPQYTVIKNITLAQELLAKERPDYKADKKKILEDIYNNSIKILDRVGLLEKEKAYPCELSGGQQQRVAIARALAKNPKILLCDEPTGALDFNTGITILKLLHDTCKNYGKNVIVITHNQAIAPMADRVITMRSGKIYSSTVNENPTPIEKIVW